MRRQRIALGCAGIVLGLFGVFRLVTQVPITSVLLLGVWMIAAVVIHDGVLSPLVLGIGVLLTRIPIRARRYVQGALIVCALVTTIAVPLIARRGSQPAAKAILQRNYAGNLTVLLAVIAIASLALYAMTVAQEATRSRPRSTTGAPE